MGRRFGSPNTYRRIDGESFTSALERAHVIALAIANKTQALHACGATGADRRISQLFELHDELRSHIEAAAEKLNTGGRR
jgi:hypothetical protein